MTYAISIVPGLRIGYIATVYQQYSDPVADALYRCYGDTSAEALATAEWWIEGHRRQAAAA